MLFMVPNDTGSSITAYCVPDSYTATASLKIFVNGELVATMQPNQINEHILKARRHETGNVDFVIDDRIVKNLASVTDLEIREAESDVLVYRRMPPAQPVIAKLFFRLETHLLPLWYLDAVFKNKFRFWWDRIDRFTLETARQILLFQSFGSCYASGRILHRPFHYYLSGETRYHLAMLMRDPYDELAERLIVLSRIGDNAKLLLNERDVLIFTPIMEIAGQCQSFDENELRQVLGKANPQDLHILSDPLTRQLTCSTPDEMPARGSLAKCLQALADFDVIGIRSEGRHFTDAVAGLLESDAAEMPKIQEYSRVIEVGKNLRAVRWLEGLIENDLELYRHVKAAHEAVTAG